MKKATKGVTNAIPLLALLIPCVIGAFGMLFTQIPAHTYIVNIGAAIALGGLAMGLSRIQSKCSPTLFVIIGVGLLLLTFVGKGAEQVHRWINLGGLSLLSAMIVIPCCLAAFCDLLAKRQSTFVTVSMLLIGTILFLQPDASQLTGFTLGCAVLLLQQKSRSWAAYLTVLGLLCLSVLSFFRLDGLEPVAHVEGILWLLKDVHPLLMVMGFLSVVLVPMPFLLLSQERMRTASVAYGLYFEAMILFSVLGNFPMPMLGFGVSPILGYCMFYAWFLYEKKNSPSTM
ncbi:MAG: hypothetical protein RR301_12330 [Clostridia bacterium]